MSSTNAVTIDVKSEENVQGAEIVQFPVDVAGGTEHCAELAAEAMALRGKNIKEAASRGQEIFAVNPYFVEIEPGFNCRDYSQKDNQEWVERLSYMIEAEGVQEPITLFQRKDKPGIYFLADGECRLRATMMALERGAPIKTIPAKLEKRLTSDAERIFAQWRRNSGKNFTAMEMASAFKRCLDYGYDTSEIAKRAGLSVQRVDQILDFDAEASTGIKDAVAQGQISVSLATTIVNQTKSAMEAEKAVKKAVAVAQSKGKTKATAKDVAGDMGVKLNKNRHIKDIFERATVKKEGDNVRLTMTQEDYDLLNKALGNSI